MNKLIEAIRKQFDFNTNSTAILAISGGVDSMVLLTTFFELAKQNHMTIVIAHVNHQLRKQSDLEEQFLKEWAREHQVAIEVTHWQAGPTIEKSVEESARNFRYTFFVKVMKKYQADYVATAHNSNDQAETFLMKLIRGGIVSELGAIQATRDFETGQIIRPLLNFSKEFIKETAVTENIEWFEDETNQSNEYLRNRIRHNIIPQLQTENEQFLSHVMDYSRQIQEQDELLTEYADEKLKELEKSNQYDFLMFKRLSESTQKLVLRRMIVMEAPDLKLGNGKLTRLAGELLQSSPNSVFNLGRNFQLIREYNLFSVLKVTRKSSKQAGSRVLRLENTYGVNGGKLVLQNGATLAKGDNAFVFSANQLELPLRIKLIDGDAKFGLKNGGHKQVRRELIDQKVPENKRLQLEMIVDANNQLIWIPGIKKSWLSKPLKTDQTVYTMIFNTGGSFDEQ